MEAIKVMAENPGSATLETFKQKIIEAMKNNGFLNPMVPWDNKEAAPTSIEIDDYRIHKPNQEDTLHEVKDAVENLTSKVSDLCVAVADLRVAVSNDQRNMSKDHSNKGAVTWA